MNLYVFNVFHEKFAQTDVSKEMLVPNAKGLKHLNTFLAPQKAKPTSLRKSEHELFPVFRKQ